MKPDVPFAYSQDNWVLVVGSIVFMMTTLSFNVLWAVPYLGRSLGTHTHSP